MKFSISISKVSASFYLSKLSSSTACFASLMGWCGSLKALNRVTDSFVICTDSSIGFMWESLFDLGDQVMEWWFVTQHAGLWALKEPPVEVYIWKAWMTDRLNWSDLVTSNEYREPEDQPWRKLWSHTFNQRTIYQLHILGLTTIVARQLKSWI